MVRGLESLDKLGVKPMDYRSPGFDFSNNTLELIEKYGFVYDASLMGNDYYPYHPARCHVNFDKANTFDEPSRIIEMPLSWYLDDFAHEEFVMTRSGMKAQSHIYEIWKTSVDYGLENMDGTCLNIVMHPQVIGRPHMITMLEELIRYSQEQNCWTAPFREIVPNIEF